MKRIPLSIYPSSLVFNEQLYICTRTPGDVKNITITGSITNNNVFSRYCENCEFYKPYGSITKDLYQSYWNFTVLKPSLLKQLSFGKRKTDIDYPHLFYYQRGLITIEQLISCDYIVDIINYLFYNHCVDIGEIINKEAPLLKSLRKYCSGINQEQCRLNNVRSYQKRMQTNEVYVKALNWYYSVYDTDHFVSDRNDDVPSFPNVYDNGKICFDCVQFSNPGSMIEAFWNSDFNSDLIFDKISYEDYDDYFDTEYRYSDHIPNEDLRDVIVNSFTIENSCSLDEYVLGEEEEIPSNVKELLILSYNESLMADITNNFPKTHNGRNLGCVVLYVLGTNGDDLICNLPDFTDNTSKLCKIDYKKLKEYFANA